MNLAVSILLGDEPFLIEEKKKALLSAYSQCELSQMDSDMPLSDMEMLFSTVSLFGQPKCGVWVNPWVIQKSLSASDEAKLMSVIDAINQSDNKLIIVLKEGLDKRKKLVKFLIKNTNMYEFSAFKEWEQDKVLDWLNQRIQSLGKRISKDALGVLEQSCGTSLSQADRQITTLITYIGDKPVIESEDVQAVTSVGSVSFYDLTQSIMSGDFRLILRDVQQLMDSGQDPIGVLGFLVSQYRFILQMSDGLSRGQSFSDIAKETGKNPYFIKRLLPQVKRYYSVESVIRVLTGLNRLDVAIKSGRIMPKTGIVLILMNEMGVGQVQKTRV